MLILIGRRDWPAYHAHWHAILLCARPDLGPDELQSGCFSHAANARETIAAFSGGVLASRLA